ncbi:CdaR family transcriptional regulator [Murinocardiopsis flavida]|uniref:CdaR family transcriptional regulator n=1 Tax=Murinocardiopsis flavida TaxID=645275 RepID=A0A2P8DM93_9ACTN|nr:helix-turn-helix domain-containing protein [Murinocardiopsis flavida]PSK98338.1 CdaR family transcriptional regulator [Murinocardiopsis flavida]
MEQDTASGPRPAPVPPAAEPTDADPAAAGVPLRRLLLAVGDPLVELLAAPSGLESPVANVVIADPEDDTETHTGDLVLLIGVRGRGASHLVRAAARNGAAAVAVKTSSPEETRHLRGVAGDTGVALLSVAPEVRWEQLQSLCQSVVDEARLSTRGDLGDTAGDLFALAQTVASLTGGLVSIEDPASRVLAYSSGGDREVDELRRLSVLGRKGPESYLALLREWGVFTKLRAGEEVVHIDEHPDLGIRRRLAVGIRAGSRPLGAIWVQEGTRPFAEGAGDALLGAARVAALHIMRRRTEMTAGLRLREDLLAGLLEGRVEAAVLADTVEVDRHNPVLVAVFAPVPGPPPAGPADAADPAEDRNEDRSEDRNEVELRRRRLAGLVSVHTAAYRRKALVTVLHGRVYTLLPSVPLRGAEGTVAALAHRIVTAAQATLGISVQAAIGPPVQALADVPSARVEADRVLAAMRRGLDMRVASMTDVRGRVLISETLELLRGSPELRDPRTALLADHDKEHGSELVPSLLAYLDAFGDVRKAAALLHVHPNTLRYRVRRAEAISGVDFADPNQRLFTHLQLLLEQR